jgi:serine/threonine-protein kinase
LDAATGVHIWNYTTGGDMWSSPAVADGKVYIGSFDKKVYCLDATTGALIWNYITGGIIESSPAVANGVVYVGSDDKKVYAFSAGPPIPEGLTIGVMMLLSTIAVIFSTRYFRKRPKTENFSQVKL